MLTEGSVTRWLRQLSDDGASVAEQELFDRYFEKLVALARQKLQPACRVMEDEEDIALSAMDSFLRRAGEKQFPKLDNRDQLWALLVTITHRKAINQFHRQTAQKRNRRPAGQQTNSPSQSGFSLESLESSEPPPEMLAQLAEEFRQRLASLEGHLLRKVALLKLEGHTHSEIADQLDISKRTVRRKVYRIRREWADLLEDSD